MIERSRVRNRQERLENFLHSAQLPVFCCCFLKEGGGGGGGGGELVNLYFVPNMSAQPLRTLSYTSPSGLVSKPKTRLEYISPCMFRS